jgi:hypothetical protein
MTVPNVALRSILSIGGWSDRRAAEVVFTGGADPALPTPFRIGAAGAAALAATRLAASELWEIRTGRHQNVTVDLRQATASLRGGRYLKLAGTSVSSAHNSIMGVYPTRDGRWSYLHCNFPNHRAAALAVLGVSEDCDAVARAVPPGTPLSSRRPSLPQMAPAAWPARRRSGGNTRKPLRSPGCRCWRSFASAIATKSRCQLATDHSRTSACSI